MMSILALLFGLVVAGAALALAAGEAIVRWYTG